MLTLIRIVSSVILLLVLRGAPALAESPSPRDRAVEPHGFGTEPGYRVLSRGRVLWINAQRFVVTQEPAPVARVAEAPPPPPAEELDRPEAPRRSAIWVAGHWAFGVGGFSWVAGRYVPARAGHALVPPRWASLDGEYFYFAGFYVPHGVYVRSFFNHYYYSGAPQTAARSDRGPYWPIGAPSRANSPLTRASARDPYWPVGAPR